jgi:head-tail adaptor
VKLAAGTLDRLIRIERPIADDTLDGAGSGTWQLVAQVSAQVQDVLPSRGETIALGSTMTRPARVRMRYRTDITPDMRFVDRGRELYIVSGPAVLGRDGGLEFVAAEYLPHGGSA